MDGIIDNKVNRINLIVNSFVYPVNPGAKILITDGVKISSNTINAKIIITTILLIFDVNISPSSLPFSCTILLYIGIKDVEIPAENKLTIVIGSICETKKALATGPFVGKN